MLVIEQGNMLQKDADRAELRDYVSIASTLLRWEGQQVVTHAFNSSGRDDSKRGAGIHNHGAIGILRNSEIEL